MEIEEIGSTSQQNKQQQQQYLTLLANEEVDSNAIKAKIKNIYEKRADTQDVIEFDNPVEIYISNMRFIISIITKDNKNDQKSIFYKDINNFRIEELKDPIKSYITYSQIKFEKDSKSTQMIYTFDNITQKDAKILTDKVIEEEEKRVIKRLAILNQCLVANEVVECKPIEVKLKVILEKKSTESEAYSNNDYNMAYSEFYITNYRFILIIYGQDDDSYIERSIFYQSIDNFQIGFFKESFSQIQYNTDNNQIEIFIFVGRLQQQDQKKLTDSYEKYKSLQQTSPAPQELEIIVKKKILEKDQKLNSFYKHAVLNKKILTEEQFWKNHEEYQKFLKYKQRDEQKIKRDYLEKEIPTVRKEINFPVEVDQLDDRINKFNQFRKEIYDPIGQIEDQNLKSFQQYKQDVYFFGQIDNQSQKIIQNQKKIQSSQIEEINIDDKNHSNMHHQHIEIVEHSLDSIQVNNVRPQEMKAEEYQRKLTQNAELEKQNKLQSFLQNVQIQSNQRSQGLLREFKFGEINDSQNKEKQQEALKKVGQRVQSSWKQAFECLYKLKPLSEKEQQSSTYKTNYENYQELFYRCREILRWLYKEQNNGDKARPEVIDTLKSELEQTKNIINEELKKVNESLKQISEQKDNNNKEAKDIYLQSKERLQDLLDSFVFKQPNI
ncbi:hypothetical protein TTHERM_00590380 (macronuclear) [Tetrahymena thermophila SB210]|uniref:Uncharacterized protein n=1 Tax=Tetrahymena thermophila (strain SB210) TaxID=312017 RepID=I7MFE7_TETTS|nr:hypothetical protein TTHERM_00590380 [Tetrahymena thermophila SB210]EAR99701.1 hypothetical protein TTHERM_00590380 [Tetrahymena thermophila SB210]|eukprot:XP_001019946.1 hypothetical protein TTHERM_00590380 [Tetrahymena thermophila SB210]